MHSGISLMQYLRVVLDDLTDEIDLPELESVAVGHSAFRYHSNAVFESASQGKK